VPRPSLARKIRRRRANFAHRVQPVTECFNALDLLDRARSERAAATEWVALLRDDENESIY
jgi:hypothetical protein